MQLLRACHAAMQAPGGGGGAYAGNAGGSGSGGGGGGGPEVHCFEVTPMGSRVGLVQVRIGTGQQGLQRFRTVPGHLRLGAQRAPLASCLSSCALD